jgi:hypothetical protein
VRPFELSTVGGPWERRLAERRRWIAELPWDEALPGGDAAIAARAMWTQTAFSEYASAAAFAEVAAAALRVGAPIDLVAAAGDFVVDEILHTEVAARIANALGGAVPMEIDYDKLVRPPASRAPLLAAVELVMRTCCIGESLTIPVLKLSRGLAGSRLIEAALLRIAADESGHAQLGWWFLDWAEPQLDDAARAHLAAVAGDAVLAFAPLLAGSCSTSGLGVVACDRYDPVFVAALTEQVAAPLAERGIAIPAAALAAITSAIA